MTSAEVTDDPELQARLALALLRVPRPLQDTEQQVLRQRIVRALDQGKALRAATLQNADEPACVFDPAPFARRLPEEGCV